MRKALVTARKRVRRFAALKSRWGYVATDYGELLRNGVVCEECVAVTEEVVKRTGPDLVLVAHSVACLAVAHWAAAKPHSPIKAALLVAIPNSKGPNFPVEARGFSETPN
jgi:hypothetical protein